MKYAVLAAAMGIGMYRATCGAAWAAPAVAPLTENFKLGYAISLQACSASACTSLPGKVAQLNVTLERSTLSSTVREIWEGQGFAQFQLDVGTQIIPLLARVQITKQTNRGSSDYWVSASIQPSSGAGAPLAEVGIGALSEESLPMMERVSTRAIAKNQAGFELFPVLRVGSLDALSYGSFH